jgi:hypothetical protein
MSSLLQVEDDFYGPMGESYSVAKYRHDLVNAKPSQFAYLA